MLRAQASVVSSVIDTILTSLDQREVLAHSSELLGQAFGVSRCVVVPVGDATARPPVEWSADLPDPGQDADSLRLAQHVTRMALSSHEPLAIDEARTHPDLAPLRPELLSLGVQSLLAVPCRFRGRSLAVLILYQSHTRAWDRSEISSLVEACYYIGVALYHTGRAESADQSESFYHNLTDRSSSAIVFYEPDGRVGYINEAFIRLSGLSSTQLGGMAMDDLIDILVIPEDRDRVRANLAEGIASRLPQGPIQYRIRHMGSGDLRWVIDQFGPVTVDEQVIGFSSSLADMSGYHESEERLRESEARYRRLVEHSDAIIFHANTDHGITFISRRALDFFGIAPEDFVAREPIRWFDLVHPDDRERVIATVSASGALPSVDEEFRVINRVSGQQRWLLTRVMAVRARDGTLIGWDGFGIDITSRREAQEALVIQSKKVRALYTVSAAIRGYIEPSNIAARGLQALCDATGAEAGLCYLYSSKKTGQLALVAHHGFAPEVTAQLATRSNFPNLSQYVAAHGQAIVIPDVKSDPRARSELAEEEGLASAVLVPISVEDEILGTLGLFSKASARFDGGDVMLVTAAASQIGLAARQADLFSAYKRQTRNLAALYRMSHELSKNLSLDDIFFHSFSVIRDELGLKRLWLGLLNETGTRITGQAAYGPGLRRRLVDINVEISGRDHPIARAVRERAPVVIDDAEDVLREFGVKRIFSRLAINSVVLVPLITSGQVLGVLTVQPGHDDVMLDEDGITLLRSLANEIAAVLLAKRFEERIAESDKMRTAGLLAAGIAHNFNNMLQAILGQASLLEMQSDSKTKVRRAAKLITDAATKGAALVKQLMSFAQLEKPSRESCDVNYLLERSVESFAQLLGAERELELNLGENLPRTFVDPAQIRQIVSNLLLNAFDATAEGGVIQISTEHFLVDEDSPHFEVPFGDYVRINIRDSGIGMDEETRKRCFEPFFTTKNVDPGSGLGMTGTGLGLAAAYALARRNGGSLVVESRPGTGSIFTLYLPVAAEVEGVDADEASVRAWQDARVSAFKLVDEGDERSRPELSDHVEVSRLDEATDRIIGTTSDIEEDDAFEKEQLPHESKG